MLKQVGFFKKIIYRVTWAKNNQQWKKNGFLVFPVEIYSCLNEKHQWNPCPLNASKNGY